MRLDDLLARTFAHFDDTFIIPLAGLRNPEDVLSGRNVCENDSSRSADTSFSFVIDVNLGPDRRHDNKARHSGTLSFFDIFRCFLKVDDPIGYR